MKQRSTLQSGFTLVEMAIALLIMGLIVGAVFSFLSVQQEQRAQQITRMKEQKIANALTYYAQIHYVLPCPSLPKMTLPLLVGDPLATCPASPASGRNGVVPFRALGLTQDDVTDGYGNAITYTVANLAHTPASTTGNNIEAACRFATSWMTPPLFITPNLNAAKSAFCCQKVFPLTNGIQIFSDAAQTIPVTQLQNGTGTYLPSNTSTIVASVALSQSYIAYVLVSHGKNGFGAYNFCQDTTSASCVNVRKAFSGSNPSPTEQANANLNNNDIRYMLMRSTSGDANNFDDIVLWRTQDRLMGELNNDSCAKP